MSADAETIGVLARNSFGSPQIMQALSLRLCRNVNNVREKQAELVELDPPRDPKSFYSDAVDPSSKKWLMRLAAGKKTKGTERNVYPSRIDSVSFDGYTVCLQAIKNLGPKAITAFDEVKAEVGRILGREATEVSRMRLYGPLTNMTDIATKEMSESLSARDREDSSTSTIPQPFFEWGSAEMDQPIKILDPVLLFAIEWHWEDILLGIERRKILAREDLL